RRAGRALRRAAVCRGPPAARVAGRRRGRGATGLPAVLHRRGRVPGGVGGVDLDLPHPEQRLHRRAAQAVGARPARRAAPARGRTIDDRQLDLFLTDYFKPEFAPAGLTRNVVRQARAMEEAMQQITQNLTIEATDRGVTLVSPRMGKAAGAARREAAGEDAKARRLAARARRELVEYLRGERAFFSVPVDLSGLPEFQRRVLETALAIPFGEV